MYTLIYDYSTILVWKHSPQLQVQYFSTSPDRGGQCSGAVTNFFYTRGCFYSQMGIHRAIMNL